MTEATTPTLIPEIKKVIDEITANDRNKSFVVLDYDISANRLQTIFLNIDHGSAKALLMKAYDIVNYEIFRNHEEKTEDKPLDGEILEAETV